MLRYHRATFDKPLLRYLVALAVVVAAYLLRVGIDNGLGVVLPPYFTFYPAIMFAAVLGGLRPGLFATALSVLTIDLLIFPPAYSFKIANFADLVAIFLFVLIGVFISILAEYYRKAQRTIDEFKAKQALSLLTAKLDLALASMTESVYISDEKGNLDHANDAFATFHKFRSKSDCLERLVDYPDILEVCLLSGEAVPLENWPVPCALRGEIGTDVECRLRRKDLGVSWLGSYNYAPIRDDNGRIVGAVVVGRDITEARQAEEKLRKSEQHYHNLFDALDEGACVIEMIYDADGKPVDYLHLEVNPAYEKQTGLHLEVGQRVREILPNIEDFWLEAYAKVALTGESAHLVSHVKETGGTFDVHAYRVGDPELRRVAVLFNNITERIRSEENITRLNRVASVLSGINQTMVRTRDSIDMLNAACRIAVERGGFRMAWIGMIDSETKLLAPVASYGRANDYLDHVSIDLRDPAAGVGPAARAFHSGHHIVCNSIEHELLTPWKHVAMELGYRSVASFPLVIDGRPAGVLSLYAGEPDFLIEGEIALLDEMAMDLSFGIEVSLHEKQRSLAEANVAKLFRTNAVLSDVTQPIVRVKDQQAMLQATCNLAVEKGKFLMAWVGLLNPETGIIEPVATAGRVEGFLDGRKIDIHDPVIAAKSIARTFLSARRHVCNNFEDLPPTARRRTVGMDLGYRSAADFPLTIEGRSVGVFCLYAGEVGFFDSDELRLLDEMAMDISFALEVNLLEQKRLLLETDTAAHLRELQILNEMNKALLAADSEKELLEAYCRIAVETSAYRMAWVGFAVENPEKVVVPVAWAGHEDGYLSAVKVMWDGGEHSRGPIGRAILSGQVVFSADIAADHGLVLAQPEAKKRGYAAVIAIPFETDPGSMACCTVYSAVPIEWSAAEQHRMQQIAHALGYGIRTIRGNIAKEQYLNDLRDSLEHTVLLIAETVERRDPYTAGHQRRVADLSVRIAKKLAIKEEKIRGLRLAATIHDLGKIGIPAEILAKPAVLSRAEFALIKEHVQIGYDIVKNVSFPWPIADMILQHHERIDGSGYPKGLSGDAILIESRILAVADVVEAMATHRPYRAARGIDFALDELLHDRGTLYDPAVVDACIAVFREDNFKFTS